MRIILKYLMMLLSIWMISVGGCANFSHNSNYLGLMSLQSLDASGAGPMDGFVFSLGPVSQIRLGGTGSDEGTTISVDASRNVIVGAYARLAACLTFILETVAHLSYP